MSKHPPHRLLSAAALTLLLAVTAVPAQAVQAVAPAPAPADGTGTTEGTGETVPPAPGTVQVPEQGLPGSGTSQAPEPDAVPAAPATDPASVPTLSPTPDGDDAGADASPQAEPSPASLAELIGPLGAKMGQGLQRLGETADPQVPTAGEERLEEQIDAVGLSAALAAEPPASAQAYSAEALARSIPGLQGMDVSSHQGTVDWQRAWNQGARFAYVKATEATSYRNPYYRQQYDGAATTGMIRGAYHFAIPSVSSGAAQANYFVNNGGGWSNDGRTLPPLLDVEYNPYEELGNTCYNMSPAQMVAWIRDFSNTMVARTGRQPMIYTTSDWWDTCTGSSTAFADHPLHIAAYGTDTPGRLPAGWANYTVWQYSSTGPFVGDSNVYRGTWDELRAFARQSQSFRTARLFFEGVGNGISYGHTSDVFLACDWDGDGVDTPAAFRDGIWYLRSSLTGAASARQVAYGNPGDQPICGDWDGDGRDSLGVYRGGTVYLRNSTTPGRADGEFNFGERGDVALAGDWNGDGFDTLAVTRPEGISQRFYLTDSNIVPRVAQSFLYGNRGDLPVAGDWNADGYDTVGVHRGITWYLTNSTRQLRADRVLSYGNSGDRPMPGQWVPGRGDGVGVAR